MNCRISNDGLSRTAYPLDNAQWASRWTERVAMKYGIQGATQKEASNPEGRS